ncbi:MAG: DNA repair protein RecN [Candidatus Schekmanbacteria bacterium]|nr:DNA repair protein RecN [Candidatus Schekmanbacteria bacterium]
MLAELAIKNFAIIEDLTISFKSGLNILTGETGAGKSIIIDALMFVLGSRASQDFIRTGADCLTVEAAFDIGSAHPLLSVLSESGIESSPAEPLFIKRDFSSNGKSSIFINNQRCTLSVLTKIGELLVDIHGQNTHQQILRQDRQLEVIDSYGALQNERSEVEKTYRELAKIKKEMEELKTDLAVRKEKEELLRFQVDEIAKSDLKPGEEAELEAERLILKNALSIVDAASKSAAVLYEVDGSAFSNIGECIAILKQQAGFDQRLSPLISRLSGASAEIDDIARELKGYAESINFDEARLEEIDERIAALQKLKRKYNAGIDEILAMKDAKESEIGKLAFDTTKLHELVDAEKIAEKKLRELSLSLSKKRKSVASGIEKKICEELSFLKMNKAQFKIAFNGDESSFSGKGIDSVNFLISPNQGEELKSLASIASGGEISRFMLAVRSILAKSYDIPVVVFDEIDAGIGGAVAEKVGEKLKSVAKERQVLCITHFPQIARFAATHFHIEKVAKKGRTATTVSELSHKERVEELAKMLGGEKVSEISRKHAEEMLRG